MAKFSGASLLLLFVALHQGSALYCYESTCLGGDTNINLCVNNNRTVKKECTFPGLQQVLRKLAQSGGSVPTFNVPPTAWTCLKHEIRGSQAGQPASVELRLCYPDSPSACTTMKAAAKGLEVQVGNTESQCFACNTEACNPAARPSSSVIALAVAAVAPLLLLRR